MKIVFNSPLKGIIGLKHTYIMIPLFAIKFQEHIYRSYSVIRCTPNLATSLLHVFKLKILLKYLVIRRTIVWGVKISQVYCKFLHKLTKKQKVTY